MLEQRPLTPSPRSAPTDTAPVDSQCSLTRAEFDALARELDELRSKHRDELARELRDARAFGSPADNDDLFAVLDEVSIDRARIARLEELMRTAAVVDVAPDDGRAGLGCAVRVVDDAERIREYVLIGRRSDDAARHEVSPASPVGRALMGARRGEVVHVQLPDGRVRVLRVLEVMAAGVAAPVPASEGGAEAA